MMQNEKIKLAATVTTFALLLATGGSMAARAQTDGAGAANHSPRSGDPADAPAAFVGPIMLRENLQPNQRLQYVWNADVWVKSTATTRGVPKVTDTENGQSWKAMLTILDVKDGSSMLSHVDMDPASFDTLRINGGAEKKTLTPFGGKSIVLTRHADESVTNDFKGDAGDMDVYMLNCLIWPDEQWYADKPVAVGDTWDNSAKIARITQISPPDQLKSQGRLDWVRTIGGKQMAHLTHTGTVVQHEQMGDWVTGHFDVEEDVQSTTTELVDVATGVVVKLDQKGSSKYVSPPTAKTQMTGGTEFTYHAEVLSDTPATQP